MKYLTSLLGGLAGAVSLTILHETVRRVNKDAPRMDQLGMESIDKSLKKVHLKTPPQENLFYITMGSDIVANTLYYSTAGLVPKKHVMTVGSALGLLAGLGAVYLPKPLGLHTEPSNRTANTRYMTVGYYLLGGVIASATICMLQGQNKK